VVIYRHSEFWPVWLHGYTTSERRASCTHQRHRLVTAQYSVPHSSRLALKSRYCYATHGVRQLYSWSLGSPRATQTLPRVALHERRQCHRKMSVCLSSTVTGRYLVSFARYSELLVENRKQFILHLYLTPRRRWLYRNFAKIHVFDTCKTTLWGKKIAPFYFLK